jgi:hypothetical protein
MVSTLIPYFWQNSLNNEFLKEDDISELIDKKN